jgi:two-component system sensor histidine kinase and response regulator WspE
MHPASAEGDEEPLNDAFMMEMFRSEAEVHVEALTSGLLALERDPGDTSHIDEMMRGAHSIKGAARVVGIDPAVRVAHVMEDGFIAAQKGKLKLRSEHVDALLRGVDLINRIANASKDLKTNWKLFSNEATPLVEEITAVLADNSPSVPSNAPVRQILTTPHNVSEVTIKFPTMLDMVSAEAARKELIAGIDSGATGIRLDLSLTTDLDAVGLAFLALIPGTVAPGSVRLIGVDPRLQQVFSVTGVQQLYGMGDS